MTDVMFFWIAVGTVITVWFIASCVCSHMTNKRIARERSEKHCWVLDQMKVFELTVICVEEDCYRATFTSKSKGTLMYLGVRSSLFSVYSSSSSVGYAEDPSTLDRSDLTLDDVHKAIALLISSDSIAKKPLSVNL